MYTPKVMDHFENPRNVGVIADANVAVQVGDPSCGDGLLIFLKIEDNTILDMKYKVFGCGAAIATSSIASEMAIGKTLEQVLAEVTEERIAEALDGLPEVKMHCSNLAASALRAGICQYWELQKKKALEQAN
jgi:nitrogen fixation protein NifU and related proteins